MYGIIDIGSNTIRLNIYKIHKKSFKLILKNKESVGLANYVVNDRLCLDGIQAATKALYSYKKILDHLKITNYSAFATASLRNIKNSTQATTMLKMMTGLDIEILSGEDEGILGYKGALFDTKLEEGLLVDIGGGSTELVHFKDKNVLSSNSNKIGSLSMFVKHVNRVLATPAEVKAMRKEANRVLKQNISKEKNSKLTIIGVGGTLRACLKINNYINAYGDENTVISLLDLNLIMKHLMEDYSSAKLTILRVCPDRIHTLFPGLCILKTIMSQTKSDKIIVSQLGVREGYLAQKLSNK